MRNLLSQNINLAKNGFRLVIFGISLSISFVGEREKISLFKLNDCSIKNEEGKEEKKPEKGFWRSSQTEQMQRIGLMFDTIMSFLARNSSV